MKKLTSDTLTFLIKNNWFYYTSPDNLAHFRPEELQKYFPVWPFELAKLHNAYHWVEQKNRFFYLLPQRFRELIPYYKDTAENRVLVQQWNQCVNDYYPKKNTPDGTLLFQALLSVEKDLFVQVLLEHTPEDMSEKKFWHTLANYPYRHNYVAAHKKVVKLLSGFVENEDDLNTLAHLLPKEDDDVLQHDILYRVWSQSLVNLAQDGSLTFIPPYLKSRFARRQNELSRMDILQVLKKFSFSVSQDFLIEIQQSATQKKVAQEAKNMLKMHDYNPYDELSQTDFFHDFSTSIVYHSTIRFDLNHLKNRVDEDALLTETLLKIVLTSFKDNPALRLSLDMDNSMWVFDCYDKEQIVQIKTELHEKIIFAFSSEYLAAQTLAELSSRRFGNRFEHEKKEAVMNNFNQIFNTWQFHLHLGEQLAEKNTPVKRSKI